MKYLLDTCVVSELVKLKPNPGVTKWLEGCDEEALFLSVLTIGDIQKGISRLDKTPRRETLQQWLDSDLRARFGDRLLPITEEVCTTWGVLLGEAERAGTPIPTIDGLIAATAVTHNLTIVTRTEKDFASASVRVVNPWPR